MGTARSVYLGVMLSASSASLVGGHPAIAAEGSALAAKGQSGLLTLSVLVEGDVNERLGKRDEMVHWSTRRSFVATLDMVAEQAQVTSATFTREVASGDHANHPGAVFQQQPSSEMAELQKQLAACDKNDTACQMRIAMQMMGTEQMQAQIKASDALAQMPPRYQLWRALPRGGRAEVDAAYQEQWQTVFYTATRESANCTLQAPAISPTLTEADSGAQVDWGEHNRKALEANARSLAVEVDAQTGNNRLRLALASTVFGDLHCTSDIGNGPAETRDSRTVSFQPPIATDNQYWIDGARAQGSTVASGSREFDVEVPLQNLGVGFAVDVKVPLHITLRWELKRT